MVYACLHVSSETESAVSRCLMYCFAAVKFRVLRDLGLREQNLMALLLVFSIVEICDISKLYVCIWLKNMIFLLAIKHMSSSKL